MFEVFDFLDALGDHVPHRRRHRVRSYGALHPKFRHSLTSPGVAPKLAEPGHIEKLGWKSWAKMLYRVYEVDPLSCECGGRFRIISVILSDDVIVKILAHLGLPTELPACSPARDPPCPASDPWDPEADAPFWEEPSFDVHAASPV